MDHWGQGYIVDIPYTDGFYPEQSPQHLALTAAITGFEAPDPEQPFTYCDLGCGKGATTLAFAAAYPHGRFYGVDFNPAHIAHGEAQTRRAGLDNITWCERSFAQLSDPSLPALPSFDFVTMHGVWSWIAPEQQQAIVRFLERHLKPGGVLYVSYNAMPGWAFMAPIQHVLKELAALWPGRSDRSVENAVQMLGRLAEKNVIPPAFHESVKRITDRPLSSVYLAHEYLNEYWKPLYHSEVARALAVAKLGFAGSTQLLRNFTNLGVSAEQRDLLAEVPVAELRDTLRDFCLGHWFHQDVYIRGGRRMTESQRAAYFNAQTLALVQPQPEQIEISSPLGSWRPHPDAYRMFLEALATEPRSVANLLALPGLPAGVTVTGVELVGVLCGAGLAVPFNKADGNLSARCERLNRLAEAAAEEVYPPPTVTIVVPSVRTGLKLPGGALELYLALKRGEAFDAGTLARRFVRRCLDDGGHPIIDGQAIENEAEAIAAAERDFAKKIERLVPVWRVIGLV